MGERERDFKRELEQSRSTEVAKLSLMASCFVSFFYSNRGNVGGTKCRAGTGKNKEAGNGMFGS